MFCSKVSSSKFCCEIAGRMHLWCKAPATDATSTIMTNMRKHVMALSTRAGSSETADNLRMPVTAKCCTSSASAISSKLERRMCCAEFWNISSGSTPGAKSTMESKRSHDGWVTIAGKIAANFSWLSTNVASHICTVTSMSNKLATKICAEGSECSLYHWLPYFVMMA